ncbi:MAG: ATP-binding cassette domain-containing protein [Sphaerospermopsis sp. SIO1G1]|nr:ATP-binding cassette domain-containing protein [Sphaerospermopsis sp. SIO1G1]
MTNHQPPIPEDQPPKKEPLIKLIGISKTFGKNKVLDNVDLEIYQGEAVGIIGPSGTGKSTILRIIAGLLAPDTGEIYIQGKKRRGLIEDGADPVGIGMVFQQAALFDSLNVDENVGFSLYENTRLKRSRIKELVKDKLAVVGLGNIGNLYPAELSGGMKKRVSFARAIMSNPDKPEDTPEVLLYDEPTAGLDPIASTVIEDLIRNLQCQQGICSTYCIVTHQDSTIRRTADRLVFLHQGKVKWQGKVNEIDNTEDIHIRQFVSGSVEGPIKVAS